MDDIDRTTALQEELASIIATFAPEDGEFRISEDVTVYRWSHPTALHHGESRLCFCAIGQGAKHVEVGEHRYVYGPDHILITSLELPMISHVVEASPERPYLSMSLELKPSTVKSVLLNSTRREAPDMLETCGFRVTPMATGVLDATVRLMRAIQNPQDAEYLAPMHTQEIIYRLLATSHFCRMQQIAGMNSVSNKIRDVLEQMRTDFHEPLHIGDVAASAGMSVSSFHDHFKQVTSLTPLQYQKQLRLREARHRLLEENLDVAEAGYAVGYRDASHFNRDYKKLFGQPPLRDIEALREAEAALIQ